MNESSRRHVLLARHLELSMIYAAANKRTDAISFFHGPRRGRDQEGGREILSIAARQIRHGKV